MIPSGSGGEIIAWTDSRTDIADVYAQKLDVNGNRLWGVGGLPVCVAANRQIVTQLVPDGAGGAYLFWFDRRTVTNSDIYGQHLDSNGNALWTADGLLIVPLHITPGLLFDCALPTGGGGFLMSWHDRVGTGGPYDSYISLFGPSGNMTLAADNETFTRFRLILASPNPSLGEARLAMELPVEGAVFAQVVDLQGRVVRVLARSEHYSAGRHELTWDGRNESGKRVGPGIYFAVARLAGETRELKVVELN
jgi:hypothetical protein